MDNLHTQLEYKEFDIAMRAPTDSWPVLDRLNRVASVPDALAATVAPEPAAIAPRRAPAAANQVAPATRAGRSLLGRYAAPEAVAPAPEAARQMPLADVFARLELAGR